MSSPVDRDDEAVDAFPDEGPLIDDDPLRGADGLPADGDDGGGAGALRTPPPPD